MNSSPASNASNSTSILSSTKRMLANATSSQSGITVIVVLTTMIIAVIIGYVAWRLTQRKMQTEKLVKTPRRLFDNFPLRITSSSIPATQNGQEFSVSMWVYLADFQPTALGKLLVMRQPGNSSGTGGGGATPFQDANPIVYVDPGSNRLYVCVRTNRKTGTAGGLTEPTTLSDIAVIPRSSNPYIVITIDYVPMQRWVHVAFSVQDYLMTVYMDGSIYAVENLVDGTFSDPNTRPMFAGCRGEFVVGSPNSNVSADLRGFVSNVAFMNYAPTLEQVTTMYKYGPASSTILSSLGMDEYRIRSPIYKATDEDST
jgi:hypothetical protein